MKKLVIGTANFNKNYGLLKSKIYKNSIVKKIFKIASKSRIHYIDTAIDYNQPVQFFKNVNFEKVKIFTKIKLSKNQINNTPQKYEKNIFKELKKFKLKYIECILLHHPNDIKSNQGQKLIETLKKLKKKKIIKKIGVSIYEPKELDFILKKFKPDLVQVPLNVFDTRILKSKYFDIIRKKKIEIQARSIFLQGLILKSQIQLEKLNINKLLINKIKNFEDWCIKKKISKLRACISFVSQVKGVKYITIGFDTPEELLQIKKEFDLNKKMKFKNFSIKNYKIIDPRRW